MRSPARRGVPGVWAGLQRSLARAVLGAAVAYMHWRAQRMAEEMPTIPAAEIERVAADGAPDDMVLVHADGTLELDSTPDDIATYQQPGLWPKYMCRAGTVASRVARSGAEAAAAEFTTLMGRQVALEAVRGPHATTTPAPTGNVPVRIGETAVTIRPDWY